MREHLTLLDNHPEKSALADHVRDEHDGRPCSFKMRLVSKHFKPLERQCSEALQITEYKEGQVMNRRGEFGENLPPDFGILEDGVYRTKRKKVEVKQQVSASTTAKHVRLEKCMRTEVCEQTEVCETAQDQTSISTETVTTDMTSQSEPTQYPSLLNVEAAENTHFI